MDLQQFHFQIIAELLAADTLSNYKVLAVLTDLGENWTLCWLENEIVRFFKTEKSNEAVSIIEDALLEESDVKDKEEDIVHPLSKRIKLENIFQQSDNPDVANMEDVFDQMKLRDGR